MNIIIFGMHTDEGGDFDYEKQDEFLRNLKAVMPSVKYFSFTSIDTAEVMLDSEALKDETVLNVHFMLKTAVDAASCAMDWKIWHVPTYETWKQT